MFGLVSLVQARTDIDDFLQNFPIYVYGVRAGADHFGPIEVALFEGKATDNVEIRLDHPDGDTRWLRGCFAPIRNESGGVDDDGIG